jgi:hypothetical protein
MKLPHIFSFFKLKKNNNQKNNILYDIDLNNIKTTDDYSNLLTYCTICDLLHINGNLIKHCESCQQCHTKCKLYCSNCNNCYDYRKDKDIISHRKKCLLAFNAI